MPLIYQYLIYVAFYTVQIHFDFYHYNDPTHSNTLICTSLAPDTPLLLTGVVRTFADLGGNLLQLLILW
jgi:hypothetical protein